MTTEIHLSVLPEQMFAVRSMRGNRHRQPQVSVQFGDGDNPRVMHGTLSEVREAAGILGMQSGSEVEAWRERQCTFRVGLEDFTVRGFDDQFREANYQLGQITALIEQAQNPFVEVPAMMIRPRM